MTSRAAPPASVVKPQARGRREALRRVATALDEADPDPRTITALLDRINGAWEDAIAGLGEAKAGKGIPLEDL